MGLYFEGFVHNAPAVLEEYYKETVTSFGVRDSSRRSHSILVQCKENTDETRAQEGKKVQLYMYEIVARSPCVEIRHHLNSLPTIRNSLTL